jgi:CheY-like chemotaxis protein
MREKPLILIADDDKNFREIISAKLSSAGFDVTTVKNGNEAVKKAQEVIPDLIIMDIYMPPGQSGTEVALALKDHDETKNIKTIFFSSLKDPFQGMSGSKEEIAKEIGTEGFIEKSADLDLMVNQVKEALGLSSITPSPTAPPLPPKN